MALLSNLWSQWTLNSCPTRPHFCSHWRQQSAYLTFMLFQYIHLALSLRLMGQKLFCCLTLLIYPRSCLGLISLWRLNYLPFHPLRLPLRSKGVCTASALCGHCAHTCHELASFGCVTSCLFALLGQLAVKHCLNNVSPIGLSRLLLWPTAQGACHCLWVCTLIQLGGWQHPGLYSKVYLWIRSAQQHPGPPLTLLYASTVWTWRPLRWPPRSFPLGQDVDMCQPLLCGACI